MLGRIADSIAVLFLKKNIINEDELPVYQYGMQVLICNIAGMLTVLIVGILISRLVESIIFITIYATLRIYTGGYHGEGRHPACAYLLLEVATAPSLHCNSLIDRG